MKFAFANITRNAKKDILKLTVISFFFNARGEGLEKSILGMYRLLLVQLLEKFPHLQGGFNLISLTALGDNEFPTNNAETMKSLFQHAVERLGQHSLACFIDALDECNEDQVHEMVAFFEEPSLPSGFISTPVLLDGQKGYYQDIANYIHSELKVESKIDQIKAEILEKSSGIFLWVVLVIPMLNKEYAHGLCGHTENGFTRFQKDWIKLFKSILTRDSQNVEELILCLQWILFAKRPLNRGELYFAILAGAEPEALKAWDLQDDTEEAMERDILSSSKGLAEMTKATKSKGQTTAHS
ncbi:hypothetical protein K469DRAFT_740286 [Zopfia rhizophila CBS 207.26]|uniref:Nephrocystin 3-like N-terminal domain-containing protein n=1 Tax=Zopfia rhizophila CBS 207.26 TaxID=1314779 RepID=A0A6A6DXE2_9PEZI|nr:hypothetical protein K469DRAFT_740286 [Zopfia rhizophila CBS 207.26]